MRWFAVLLVALLALAPAAGVGVGQSADDRVRASGAPPDPVAQTASPPSAETNDTTQNRATMRISLRGNGDARWEVTTRFALRNENETAAFRQLADEYERGETDVGVTSETFERIATRTAHDRETDIRNVNRSARLRENGTLGEFTLAFTWTNFSRVDGEQVILDDAFETESGTWLELNADQTLIIEAPPGYVVWNSPGNAELRNGTLIRYDGPATFERGDVTVTYEPRSPGQGTTTPGGWADFSGLPGIVLLLFLLVGGTGAYAWTQRRDGPEVPESVGAPATSAPPSDDGETEGVDDADEEDEPDVDVELLSDEERVLRLLRENDGRMKQADIVKETNWSNAKVSQLLSKMDENDEVDKLRIGRENLITLPDEDVADLN